MTTALFLATKTESMHMTVDRFVRWLNPIKGLGDLTTEEVLAPEYTFAQGLRYTYDVRHPHRALKGAFLELQLLLNYARGDRLPESWRPENTVSSKDPKGWDIQRHLMQVYGPPTKFAGRVERAYQRAREILGTKAVLSDAYFLFTPSQIMFAALLMSDADIARDLLRIRLTLPRPGPAIKDSGINRPSLGSVMGEVEACTKLLEAANTEELMGEARRVAKKLEGCRNPDKIDLVGLNKSRKRDAAEDGKLEENLAKKRRLEREKAQKEGEDLFGPKLV
jgi:cyclin H